MSTNRNSCGVRPEPMGFGLLVTVFASALSLASLAEARITQLQVVRLESPTFGGMTRSSLQRFTTQKTRLNSTLTSKHVISGK